MYCIWQWMTRWQYMCKSHLNNPGLIWLQIHQLFSQTFHHFTQFSNVKNIINILFLFFLLTDFCLFFINIFSFQLPFWMIYKHNNKKQSIWKCITMEFDVIKVMNHDKIVFHFILVHWWVLWLFSIHEIMKTLTTFNLKIIQQDIQEEDLLPSNDHVLTFKISLHFSTEISNLQDLFNSWITKNGQSTTKTI